MLRVKNLEYSIKDKKLLSDISFDLSQGENLLLLGKSGSGKTTLINILTGLITGYKGQIFYDDVEFSKLNQKDADIFRGKNMAIIFQIFHLIKEFSVIQNLNLINNIFPHKVDKEYLDYLVEKTAIKDLLSKKVSSLSIGERQRVAITRALLSKPKWLFCDEVTSSLDDENCQNVMKLITEEAKANNSSIIITTHDDRVKNYISGQIINLSK